MNWSLAIVFLCMAISKGCRREILPVNNLAPPPIHLSGPLPNDGREEWLEVQIDGKKYLVTFKDNKLDIRADHEPTYPLIIKLPGGSFWIKIEKGKPFITLEILEQQSGVLLDALKKVMKLGGPPTGGGGFSGNGGDENEPQPFFEGDLVTSKTNPNFGVMEVLEVKKVPSFTVGKYWWAIKTYYEVVGDGMTHNYFAKSSDFILVARRN